jgi:UDP-glucose 4,6-dehydratase
MILLLGATGYLGQAFADELRRRHTAFEPITRRALDYTRFETLFDFVHRVRPGFVINAAGYMGKPDIDACEAQRAETVLANTLLPQTVARVCYLTKTPWGHVSSGCIYSGAKVEEPGGPKIERSLNQPEIRKLFDAQPDRFRGFSEADESNFSFRAPPCSFYSGTKALAEEAIRWFDQTYIWRPKALFDEFDHPQNFLSKIQQCPKVHDSVNSMTHRGDFVRACLDLWERRAAFGTYNVINPGAASGRQIAQLIQQILKPGRPFEFWENDEAFYQGAARALRSNCILDASKLLGTGVRMRPVQEALQHSLENWQPHTQGWLEDRPRSGAVK